MTACRLERSIHAPASHSLLCNPLYMQVARPWATQEKQLMVEGERRTCVRALNHWNGTISTWFLVAEPDLSLTLIDEEPCKRQILLRAACLMKIMVDRILLVNNPRNDFKELLLIWTTSDTGGCCEALNAAAAELIIRRRSSLQSTWSTRRSQDKNPSLAPSAHEIDIEASAKSESSSQAPIYKGLKHVHPCLPVTLRFTEISMKVKTAKRFSGFASLPCIRQIASLLTPPQMKTILQGVSGSIQPGEMVALMGASGAGKSTLLNILSRRVLGTGGSVFFNDKQMSANEVKRICCFIQQTDLFYGFLTVAEHLDCVARLRTGWTKERRAKLVHYLSDMYGLAKVKDSRIGNLQMGAKRGISGGEKKRLSIATEMMTNPSVIFADEPTTGLDSFIAESVMWIFRVLADQGRTIICTIHQPSSTIFNMFSRVLLLSQGRVVFFGDREATLLYFSRLGHPCPAFTSVPEFLLELLAKHQMAVGRDDEKEENVLSPDHCHIVLLHPKLFFFLVSRCDHRCEEVLTLVHRSFTSNSRNPRVFQARVFQTLILALLAGLIFFRLRPENYLSRNGACTFIVLNQGSLGMVSVLQTFTSDKILAVREYRSGLYRLSSYFCGKLVADFALQICFPIGFATIVWYMIGFNDAATRWLIGLGYITLTANSAISLGYLLSSFAPTLQFASAMIPIVFMPLVLTSGFMVILSSMSKFWIWLQYLSPFRWGWSAVMRAIWEGVELDACPPGRIPPECYSSGEQVLEYYAVNKDSYWFCAMMLFLQIVVENEMYAQHKVPMHRSEHFDTYQPAQQPSVASGSPDKAESSSQEQLT
ncbi:hypothetical protein Esti_005512 [Eimeria stiedai]